MIRFRINELLAECNAAREEEDRLHMQSVADAIGVPRSTLAGLTTRNREPVTNTATLEALFRFFQLHHPRFKPAMLFEFDPPLEETVETRVDRLYQQRAEKSRRSRRRR